MQAFKVICVALLCAGALAQPCDDKSQCASGNHTKEPTVKLDWYENGVFYQIYPRSFKDSNGNGIGDIRGVIEKLDYLKELGVTGSWLSPIFKSPMKDFGYDISDFKDIDPTFGTLEDIEELFKQAKEKGIKIILDFVPNHTSDEHEWFKKSLAREEPYDDYYIWRNGTGDDGKQPPNNWVSVFYGSAWTYREERQQWYYHNFVKEQPDLNYRNQAVVDEMMDVLKFWLMKGANGFRIDAVNHLFEDEQLRDEPLSGLTEDSKSYDFLNHTYTIDLPEVLEMVYKFREFSDKFAKENKVDSIILMTEAYTTDEEYVKYFKSKDGRPGSQMPFNFVLIGDLDRYSSAATFKQVIDGKIASVPKDVRLNWVMGNHDKPRVGSRYGERRIDGLLTLVMTLPGIAVTYNGEEIGMVDHRGISFKDTHDPAACNLGSEGNWLAESRDPERTPFQWDATKFAGFMSDESTAEPWLPIHPNYKDVNVALQKSTNRTTFNFYKQLVKLRKEKTFAIGSFDSAVFNNDNVFAYVRGLKDADTYVVLINFGAREEKLNINTLAKDLPKVFEVAAVSPDSHFVEGAKVKADEVVLRKYDAIILKAPHDCGCDGSGAGSIFASALFTFGLVFASIAHFVF